jgi:predicted phosphodiesterase
MKIYLCSDVHIEFGPLEVHNRDNADVLILSGDIVTATDLEGWRPEGDSYGNAKRFMEFFEQCSTSFKHVLYVMGNHEHYHGDFATSADTLRTALKEFPNIRLMDKESVTIDDITFIGGTLWTDMNKEDPHTLYSIKGVMNDFRIIKNSSRKVTFKDEVGKFHEREARFCPEDTVEDHKDMKAFIDEATKDSTKKYVVIGHHSPSKLSTHPRYKNEVMMNGAYSSDLSEFILDHPQIKLWTHGHTHDPYDYMIGSTRIVCNPRGYINYEEIADNFDFKLLEI